MLIISRIFANKIRDGLESMRKLKGTIISNKMAKTVVVKVGSLKKHEKYQKFYKVSKKYKAHDEKGEYKIGDVVIIQETRPMSKEKRWRVVELVKRPAGDEVIEEGVEAKLDATDTQN